MNSNQEPHFLVDEELVELESILKDIEFRLKNPDFEKNQMLLQAFVKACIKATKPKPIPKISLPEPTIIKPRRKIIPEKKPTIIKEIKKKPNGKKLFPVPIPSNLKKQSKIKEFKAVPRFKKETVEHRLSETQLPLIQDKISKKLLALADINDKYVVREPPISKEEIQILKQVIQENPQNPKQGWYLLKEKAPNLSDDQLTNIKYYLVNSLFALGRLEPLLHDDKITEIMCDGVGEYLRIKRDNKVLKTNIIFKDKEDLDAFLQKLTNKFNKTLDENNPIIDTVHRDYRFHIILGLHGASSKFTIKKVE